jgi:Xaa-Pro aminopeptidase
MGPSTLSTFKRLKQDLPRMQEALREVGLDGWLLYDLHARNSVTAKLTDLGDLTRRYFVLIPSQGEPFAAVHGIEETPWTNWPWQRQTYVGWRQLEEALKSRLAGKRLAMEISEGDAVPALDLVPSGVVDLVRSTGAQVTSSGNLVTRFYSCWSDEDLASHRRSSTILMQVAHATFMRIGRAVAAGETVTEAGAKEWVIADLVERGVRAGGDCIVAGTLGAADPHYSPVDNGATLRQGDIVLLDLWGRKRKSRCTRIKPGWRTSAPKCRSARATSLP